MTEAVDRSYTVGPLDAGAVLDHAIYLYRDHFKVVAAIMGLFLFPMLVVMDGTLLVLEQRVDAAAPTDVAAPLLLALSAAGYSMVLQVLVMPLATGALTYALASAYTGRPIPAKAAIGYALRRAFRLIGAAFVAQVIIIAGTCLFVIPGIYAQVLFIPLFAIIILEDCSVRDAFSRCSLLMQGERLKGLLLLFAVLVVSMASGVLDLFVGLPYLAFIWADILQAFATGLPVAAWTVFYFSARSRSEYLDIELNVQEIEQTLQLDAAIL